MPLETWALAVVEEVARDVGAAEDGEARTLIERFINDATEAVETELRRRVVFRGTDYVEFHSPKEPRAQLWLGDAPIVSVTEVNEDQAAVYGAATILAASDFAVHKGEGKLTRIAGGGTYPRDWLVGVRVQRVTYKAGYERVWGTPLGGGFPSVPRPIREIARELAVLKYREWEHKRQGVSTVTDGAGTITRYTPAELSERQRARLAPFVRTLYCATHEAA